MTVGDNHNPTYKVITKTNSLRTKDIEMDTNYDWKGYHYTPQENKQFKAETIARNLNLYVAVTKLDKVKVVVNLLINKLRGK